MARSRHSGVVSGITLIVIGLLLFWLNRLDDLSDSIVFFVIGNIFQVNGRDSARGASPSLGASASFV